MAENKSKFMKVVDLGYKFCLILGIGIIFVSYHDVSNKERALSDEIRSLQAKFEEGETNVRKRRSLGLDDLFRNLNNKIDSLERR